MAAEKKKTKAQIKKEETEQRHAFIANAFNLALRKIYEGTKDNRRKLRVSINYTNYNRYIKFSAYSKSLEFMIYGDGNVAIQLNEFCHSKHTEQIFEYVQDNEKQNEFLHSFEELAEKLIREFIGENSPFDWHSYMDFVSSEGNAAGAFEEMARIDAMYQKNS